MPETNWNKINFFIILAFGISWLSAFYMRFSQIEYGTEASLTILAFFYMPAPAIAAYIVQRIIARETLFELGFTIKGISWKWALLYTPMIFLLLYISAIMAVYIFGNVLGISQFGILDFSNEHFFKFLRTSMSEEQLQTVFPIDQLEKMNLPFAWFILVAGIFIAFLVGYTINLPFTLGEELGWRGLLLHETRSWGFWKCNFFIGSIWGLWHGPIIMMGHNYPNYPIFGIAMMIMLCIGLSFVLSYIRYKTKTVFGPAAFHGMINASAGILLFLVAKPNELVGSLAGLAGLLGALTVTVYIYLFDREFIETFKYPDEAPLV